MQNSWKNDIFSDESNEWFDYFEEIDDESVIKIDKSQKTLNLFQLHQSESFDDHLNFDRIHSDILDTDKKF